MARSYQGVDIERLKELHEQGLGWRKTAAALGCDPSTVTYHRKKLGLAPIVRKAARPIEAYTTDGLLSYIEGTADRGLDNVELNRLGEAANIRRRIMEDIQDWVRVNAEAMYANFVRGRRQQLRQALLRDSKMLTVGK